MRLSILAALACLSCTAPAPTRDGSSAAPFAFTDARRAELLQAREAVWRAWFAHDTAQLKVLLPDNLIAIPPVGNDWQSLNATLMESRGFAGSGGKLVRLEFPRTEIQTFGPVAVVYSTYLFETETGGQRSTIKGRVSEVFEYRDGRWVNPSWHMDNDP
jgi:Domain of unknown function (DUF4440)